MEAVIRKANKLPTRLTHAKRTVASHDVCGLLLDTRRPNVCFYGTECEIYLSTQAAETLASNLEYCKSNKTLCMSLERMSEASFKQFAAYFNDAIWIH
jgi:hypothetical protein